MGHGDLAASLVLIFPLILVYAIGVLVTNRVTGADLVSRVLLVAVGHDRAAYLIVYAVLAIGFLVWLRRGDRRATLRLDVALPVIFEAAIYAFTLGTVISLVVDRLLGLGITGPSIIGAIGAGVHEELVFRLGIMAGLVAWSAPHVGHRAAVALAILLSSLAFSGAHHLGAQGEPWNEHAFIFRTLAGVAFSSIFWFRSLAHAVYAHVLYDIVVAAAQ
ncbi:MAG: CPBP family glutamic-type intramembrane protease [Proteobacteria bacterium]|nr:CPBP family glutamic-type intramembrane protease [Pseudomonadota bacterium]